MRRIVFIIVCLALSHPASRAQADMINVSGQVRCGTEPVTEGIVAMLQPSDSSIVAYSMTDQQGCYSLNAVPPSGEILIKVIGFNIRQNMIRVKACSQTLDLNVETENIILREVVINSKKVWENRDTLNYLVSAYTREHDRTIGDVLCQLPGITIEDNGTIKYQGSSINHFYIEDQDMLQGRYNLGTQSIKAEDVAIVQVLENHEHVRALQDQMPTGHAAINLKLKNKAKGVWTKTADLGAGGYSDGLLWDATLQTMYLDETRQHMIRYSGDNMGRAYDAASAYYGISSSDAPPIVGIIGHGASPVGNGLFGYRHGANLNNIAKFSDSATLNYNFNYSHNLSRGSSFSQTTYILPNDSNQLLTENIADRIHTNSVNLQFTYEKNAECQFLNNTLSIVGLWNEGRGDILSDNLKRLSLPEVGERETSVLQSSHYRSLGLTNRTRLISRTAKGGGIEWTSTNSFSSTPQSLAINGDMTARQDINLTSVSTFNSFGMFRGLQTRHWTFTALAHLNTIYTALTSELTHPDAPIAPHGDMNHIRINADIGPVGRYVNGTFQSILKLPVAMTYTSLDNAHISNEKTDADRVRLYLQPSASLLWKATDNFTFNAGVSYAAYETAWEKLLTASVMQNYRSLSRYRAALNDSYSADARIKVQFKDVFNALFAHLEGKWNRSWSDIAYGSTLDAKAHTVIETAYMPNHSNYYSVTAYGRKDIDWHTIQIELSATATHGENEILRQSILTKYRTIGYVLRGTLAFDIVNGYSVNYNATLQHNRSVSTNYAINYNELTQRSQFNMRLFPSLFLNFHVSHTHNSSLASRKKDYLFIGGGLQFKMSKKFGLNLDGENLTNIHTYTTWSLGDMEEYYTEYYLRPLSVTLTAHIYF